MMKDVKRRALRQVLKDAFRRLWKDIKAAKWVIMFIIAYFVLPKYLGETAGGRFWKFWNNFLYSLCPMVMITGLPCPGCGLTRAGFCLLRLDFAGAYRIHPFIYAIAVYIAIFAWNRYIRLQKAGRFLKVGLIVILVGMILFYLWRMAVYFPGDPPMSYYPGNLLAKIWRVIHCMKNALLMGNYSAVFG